MVYLKVDMYFYLKFIFKHNYLFLARKISNYELSTFIDSNCKTKRHCSKMMRRVSGTFVSHASSFRPRQSPRSIFRVH